MELIFEILLQVLGELLLQVIFEALAEFGFHQLSGKVKRPQSPVSSAIGFVFWGALAGGLSLLLLPTSAIREPWLRIANLVITPILAGILMEAVGRQRSRKNQALVRLDRFGYAFIFAFTMALIRFVWAA